MSDSWPILHHPAGLTDDEIEFQNDMAYLRDLAAACFDEAMKRGKR